jgi:hypothetical protein
MQKMDAPNQKSQALEHTVGELTLQIKKSIKTGQTVTLHTEAGHGGGLTLVRVEIRAALFSGMLFVLVALCGPSISKLGGPKSLI